MSRVTFALAYVNKKNTY